ncbi:hypothetical protein B0H11DRAFT_1921415 [Mycena galericulata]|nr:hypothetical protein B0H11DRAFT_1921415 [Mycena galericulata]
MYLGPTAAIAPRNLHAVLCNHKQSFLGEAQYGVDFIDPLPNNWNRNAYVSAVDPNPSTEASFKTVLFGSIASKPRSDLNRCFIQVECPDWSAKGWDAEEFTIAYAAHQSTLSAAVVKREEDDLHNDKVNSVRSWTEGERIVVDVYGSSGYALYRFLDKEGRWMEHSADKTGHNFPFMVGDTVLIPATLHCTECPLYSARDYRDYAINAVEMQAVRVNRCEDRDAAGPLRDDTDTIHSGSECDEEELEVLSAVTTLPGAAEVTRRSESKPRRKNEDWPLSDFDSGPPIFSVSLHFLTNMPPGVVCLFRYPELVDYVFAFCALRDLVLFSHAGPISRSIFVAYVGARMKVALAPFLGAYGFDPSIAALNNTLAIIVGSVPALFICENQKRNGMAQPWDLNIITPYGTFQAWANLMESMDAAMGNDRVSDRFLGKIVRHQEFIIRNGHETVRFTVSESSTASVLRPAFHAKYTSQMTVISSTHIVIPYSISLEKLYVPGLHVEPEDSGCTHYNALNEIGPNRPCGTACPYIWRTTRGFTDILEVAWRHGSGASAQSDVMRNENEDWRLGHAYETLYTAMLVPTGDVNTIMVHVPARMGLKRARTVSDLDVSMWINPGNENATFDFDQCAFFVDRFPLDEPEPYDQGFYIITAPQPAPFDHGGIDPQPVNRMVEAIAPGIAPKWKGNVLIVKYDVEDMCVVNVDDSDIQNVFGMVRRVLREGWVDYLPLREIDFLRIRVLPLENTHSDQPSYRPPKPWAFGTAAARPLRVAAANRNVVRKRRQPAKRRDYAWASYADDGDNTLLLTNKQTSLKNVLPKPQTSVRSKYIQSTLFSRIGIVHSNKVVKFDLVCHHREELLRLEKTLCGGEHRVRTETRKKKRGRTMSLDQLPPEIEYAAAAMADLVTLLPYSKVSRRRRAIAQQITDARVARALARFFPSALTLFWSALGEGIIAGSTPHWVSLAAPDWLPRDLNLLVPLGECAAMLTFLTSEGWTGADAANHIAWTQLCNSVIHVSRAERDGPPDKTTVFSCEGFPPISLTETGQSTVFRVLLLGRHTLQTAALSKSCLLAMNPEPFLLQEAWVRSGGEHTPMEAEKEKRCLEALGIDWWPSNGHMPFNTIYDALIFPTSSSEPLVVPVPLDYGCDSYEFFEDLRVTQWVTLGQGQGKNNQVAGTVMRCNLRTHAIKVSDGETLWAVFKTERTNDFKNLLLLPLGCSLQPVHGDVLFVKEVDGAVVSMSRSNEVYCREAFSTFWENNGDEIRKRAR